MGKKLTFEYIQNYFKEQKCELLDTKYINSYTKMKYICYCKQTSEISFDNFKQGHRCKKCAIERRKEQRKFSYEFVENFFKEQNCELLEKIYINVQTKMKYKCICGNESNIRFDSFQAGSRCNKCGIIRASDKLRLTYNFVKNYFEEQGCELLETEYINTNTLMKYKCKCNNISKIIFGSFQTGTRCMICSGSEKLSYNFVKKFFEEQGCELNILMRDH